MKEIEGATEGTAQAEWGDGVRGEGVDYSLLSYVRLWSVGF